MSKVMSLRSLGSQRVVLSSLRPGEAIVLGGKTYARCADCRKIVRIDKPLFGSLHLCTEDRP